MKHTRLLLALLAFAVSAVRAVSSVPENGAGQDRNQANLPPLMWTCQTRPEKIGRAHV